MMTIMRKQAYSQVLSVTPYRKRVGGGLEKVEKGRGEDRSTSMASGSDETRHLPVME